MQAGGSVAFEGSGYARTRLQVIGAGRDGDKGAALASIMCGEGRIGGGEGTAAEALCWRYRGRPVFAMAINVGPAAVMTVIHCPPDTAHTFCTLHPAASTLTCLCLDPPGTRPGV